MTTKIELRLWVAGRAPNSVAARANLARAIRELGLRHALHVTDVLDDAAAALAAGVIVTPTLDVLGPVRRRIVGDLSDRAALELALVGDGRA